MLLFLPLLLAWSVSGAIVSSRIMMRHCVRAPTNSWSMPSNYSNNPNAYTAQAWPSFGVPAWECTARGLQIIEAQGKYLAQHGRLPTPISMVSDTASRCVATARSLAKGLNLNNITIPACGELWSPVNYGICSRYPDSVLLKSTKDQLASVPKPIEYKKGIEVVQRALGTGSVVKTPISEIPDILTASGEYTGGVEVANQAMESFMLEQGTGLSLGWNRLTVQDLYKHLDIHIYSALVNGGHAQCASAYSNYYFHFLRDIRTPGTLVYAGHDSDMYCFHVLTGLFWKPLLFPSIAAVPGSFLRFDLDDQNIVTTHYLNTHFTTTDGHLYATPAKWKHTGNNHISLDDLSKLMMAATNPQCIGPDKCN